jgi:hypothetical protein
MRVDCNERQRSQRMGWTTNSNDNGPPEGDPRRTDAGRPRPHAGYAAASQRKILAVALIPHNLHLSSLLFIESRASLRSNL